VAENQEIASSNKSYHLLAIASKRSDFESQKQVNPT